MDLEPLRQAIGGYRLLLLDTMVFSYHLSDHPRYAPLAAAVLEAVEAGRVLGLTTTITLAEILTRPAQMGDRRAMQEYEAYLTHFPNLSLMPLDAAVARRTARVRAAAGLRTPDAVQVAAAQLAGAGAIVTNDRRWVGRVSEPELVLLDDYVA